MPLKNYNSSALKHQELHAAWDFLRTVGRKMSSERQRACGHRAADPILVRPRTDQMENLAILDIVRTQDEGAPGGAARVFTFFRDKLLSGELKAGDRLLAERELALALGVSRPVLREALRSLAMLGLLDIRHGRGAFVRAADASVLGQALTLCLAPEPNILDDVLQARIA